MNFDFTDEQTMLRDSVSRYLADNYDFARRQKIVRSSQGTSPEVWRQLSDFGLLSLPFSEDVGGIGGSIVDVVAICELFGQHLLVEPYLSSILLAGRALIGADNDGTARDWLARIMSGNVLGAFAHEEGHGLANPADIVTVVTASDDGYRLDGSKRLVLDGGEADILVVSARTPSAQGNESGLALLLVDPKVEGVTSAAFTTIDGRRAAHVNFHQVEIPREHMLNVDAGAAIEALVADAIIALAAEAVGAMGALLRITSQYAATRKQFGVPIASFQAVAHRLADMKIAFTKARSTLLYTTALAEARRATPRDISLLKAQVGRLGRMIGEAAVQTHGGVGMTDELAVGHYLKRLLAIDAMFGSGEHHLRKIGAGHS